VNLPPSPYRGLSAFGEAELDALFFFGRERETELIAANLLASRLTILYGASGVGKTSILRAGVAREVRALPEAPLVVVFDAWGVDANDKLAAALAGEAGIEPLPTVVETVEAVAREADVYLVLDQIEELFLYERRDDERSVIGQLPDLVVRPGLRAHLTLGVREDALAQLDVLKTRIPGLLANRLRLDHLDREAARQAIAGPIARWNELGGTPVELEPRLVDVVLDEVAAGRVAVGGGGRGVTQTSGVERVETPYLQLVMERIWEVERGDGSGSLRADTLGRLGGAGRIVRDHLDEALEALSERDQAAAARMFDHLVTPSGTKISHTVSDLAEFAEASTAEVQPVLDRLTTTRILRSGGDGAGRRYEIFHDVLADAVLEWRTRWYAQRIAELARRDAERRRRNALVVAGIALAGLAVMTIVAIFALGQRHQAVVQRREARSQARAARSSERLARARALIATAASQLDTTPQQSLVLALRAARLEETPEVGDALREALARAPLRLVLPADGGRQAKAVFSPDDKLVLAAGKDGNARLFDAGTGRLARSLHHGGPVTDVAFAGNRVLTASSDGTARLWTMRGAPIRTLHHGSPVAAVAASGDLIATAGGPLVRIWRGGRQIGRLDVPGARLISFTPDGRELAVGGGDRSTRVFAVPSGRPLFTVPQNARVTSVTFSPAGDVLATTSADKTTGLWDARTGKQIHLLHGHRGPVLDAAFSTLGKLLVTTSDDDEAIVWNVANGTKVAVLFGHTNAVETAAFSPDATHVVTASDDHDARVWETAGGHARTILRGHGAPVLAASFDSSGTRVITASSDGTARVWDPGTGNALTLLGRHRGPILAESTDVRGSLVVTAGADHTARIWRPGHRGAVHALHHPAAVLAASFNPDASLVVTACADGRARVWRVASGALVTRLGRARDAVTQASFSPDGSMIVTGDADGLVRLWRPSGGAPLKTLRHRGAVTAASFSADSRLLLTASHDQTARIWRVRDWRLLHSLPHHGRVVSAAFSPSSRLAVTSSSDGTATIWNVASGRPVRVLPVHGGSNTSAVFSPNGRLVLTAGRDQDARLWDVATGVALRALRAHVAAAGGASFSLDGRWIVTAGVAGASVWETSTGMPLLLLHGHRGPLTGALFTRGDRIVTTGSDDTVRYYRCLLCGPTPQIVRLAKAREAALRGG